MGNCLFNPSVFVCLRLVVFFILLMHPLPSAFAYNWPWDQGHDCVTGIDGKEGWSRYGYDGKPAKGDYTTKECCKELCKLCPIYANTGRYQRSVTDLSVPGLGPGLVLTRTYDSQHWSSSLMGNGWIFNFGKRLVISRNRLGQKILIVRLETGEQNYFTEHADGSLQRNTAYGASYDLVKIAGSGYRIINNDGSQVDLRADGKIAKIVDKNGNTLTFEYDSTGCLVRITNASGNYIDFQVGANGKIADISDNLGRVITYEYDTDGNLTGVMDPMSNKVQYVYNSDNLLITSIDANGNVKEAISYDDHQPPRVSTFIELGESYSIAYIANRTEKTDSLGNKWTYYYNDLGFIEQVVDPTGAVVKRHHNQSTFSSIDWLEDSNGNRVNYSYDASGNLTSVVDPLGNSWINSYIANSNLLETQQDPLGVVSKHEYDTNGNRTKTIRDFGGLLESAELYTYDNYGNQTSVTSALQHTTNYEYDQFSNLLSIVDSLGNKTLFTYDNRGNRLSETDALGKQSTFNYDLLNRLTTVTDTLGRTTHFAYDANGNKISETDNRGNTKSYSYDALDRVIQQIDPMGVTHTMSYDQRGNVVNTVNPNGNSVSYSYSAQDTLVGITDALGHTTSLSYDASGKLLSMTDPQGHVSQYSYDTGGRLVASINALDESYEFEYSAVGDQTRQIQPDGNIIDTSFDSLGRIVRVADSLGEVINYSYDLDGRLLSESNAQGIVYSYSYDAMGRMLIQTDALGNSTHYSYDAMGRLLEMLDREGNKISYSYDSLGNKISETDALGNTTTYSYDEVDNLISMTDVNGIVTSFDYDVLNRLTGKTYASGTEEEETLTFSYDAVGNMISRVDADGQTINYVYDAANRKITIDYPGTNDSSFTYSKAGFMLTAVNDSASIQYAYDAIGRLTQEIQNEFISNYAYDAQANTKTVTYPNGDLVYELRNARGNLIKVENAARQAIVEYQYDAAGRQQGKSTLNGVTQSLTRDEKGMIVGMVYQVGSVEIVGLHYGYDLEGNRLFLNRSHSPSDSEQYLYDQFYRLIEFRRGSLDSSDNIVSPIRRISYQLDALSNWSHKTLNQVSESRIHNKRNQIGVLAGVSYLYDKRGNLTDDGENVYQYDYDNHLTQVTRKSDGISLGVYAYDALGRRVSKEVNGITTTYIYQSDRVIAENTSAGGTSTYIYGSGIDELIAMGRPEGWYYYHSDALDSIVALTDATGEVVERYYYDAYGEPSVVDSVVGNPYKFTGRRHDSETGLQYSRHRYLSHRLGRWLSRDPAGYTDSLNLYEYVTSNPVNLVDPSGLKLTIGSGTADILSQLNFLCPKGKLKVEGGVVKGDCCELPDSPKYTCSCICRAVEDDKRTISIDVVKEGNNPREVEFHDGIKRRIPYPNPGPHTRGSSRVIVPPSSGATFQYGLFDSTGKHFIATPWRILGHELCGHAWEQIGYFGSKGNRPGHDGTIQIENKIAIEHGDATVRGLFANPNQGESTHRLKGESKYYYKLKDGWHSGP